MIRAVLALVAWFLYLIFAGIPLMLIGLIRPSRRLMAAGSYSWSRTMLWLCGVRLDIVGGDAIGDGRPRFFIGNHQSALDIPIMIVALRGDVRFLAKDSLFRVPIFGWVLWQYGYISIDRHRARAAAASIEKGMAAARRDPISFVVFPEGTRSFDGRLGDFRLGAIKIGQRWGMPVVPFSIDGAIDVLPRGRMFYVRPGKVRLTFGEPIPEDKVARIPAAELHDRVREVVSRQLGVPPEKGEVGRTPGASVAGSK